MCSGPIAQATPGQAAPPSAAQAPQAVNDLDAFMRQVLERRDETWRRLHDYVLDETEQFRILGPGGVALHGMKREFTWYVREGFLIRSPLRFDGVTLSEAERRKYEQHWLDEEKAREAKAARKASKQAQPPGETDKASASSPASTQTPAAAPDDQSPDASLQDFVSQRGEPRFVSEAYFLRFKFEPGNYYFAGRDTIDGRPVVKVEYYPTRLFDDEHAKREEAGDGQDKAGKDKAKATRNTERERARDKAREDEYERKFNKVALVTLWIDPVEHQIVRYTFDNIDFGFLPGRWLVRLDEIRAEMTMARVLDGVWLPARIDMRGGLSLASGGYQFVYGRRFSNYKKAETGARIRSMTPRDFQ
jgi:hypothetical protein